MKKLTKATAGTKIAGSTSLYGYDSDESGRMRVRLARRIDAAIRRAVKAERERCRKIVSLSASDAREMGDRSDSFGACERCILSGAPA